MNAILTVFSIAFGLVVGSFLNALIYRLPRDINVAHPRSSCPNCKKLIYWYENIPVLSFIFLRGKCSGCETKISFQYPLVELVAGIFAGLIAPRDLVLIEVLNFLFFFGIFSAFLVHFIVDIKHQILPDSVNIYLLILFFICSFLIHPWTYWLIGGAVGLGFPLLVSWIFYLLRGEVGLGGGDIKLYAVLGIYLGPFGIIQNIFLSCFLGAIVGLILLASKLIKRENPIPFGPFILIIGGLQIFADKWFSHLLRYIP